MITWERNLMTHDMTVRDWFFAFVKIEFPFSNMRMKSDFKLNLLPGTTVQGFFFQLVEQAGIRHFDVRFAKNSN